MKIKLLIFLGVFTLLFTTIPTVLNASNTEVSYDEAGTFPVKYSYYDEATGEYVEVESYVTIEKPHTVINIHGQEAIDANDFIVDKGKFKTLTDADLIQHASAHAWSTITGEDIPITQVKAKNINSKQGMHQVTFSTERGSEVTVNVLEQKESSILPKESYFELSGQGIFAQNWQFYFLIPIVILLIIILFLLIYSTRKRNQVDKLLYKK